MPVMADKRHNQTVALEGRHTQAVALDECHSQAVAPDECHSQAVALDDALAEHHTLSAMGEMFQTGDVEPGEKYLLVVVDEYQIQAAPVELSENLVGALEKHQLHADKGERCQTLPVDLEAGQSHVVFLEKVDHTEEHQLLSFQLVDFQIQAAEI